MELKSLIRNTAPYRAYDRLRSYASWSARDFAAPSPHYIKQRCVLRNGQPNGTWVETGTYLGQTTEVLARLGNRVYSVEPEPTLYANAKARFAAQTNVEILNGTSEAIFPTLLPKLSGEVNFWLDGHYSAGITFKGAQETPILDELSCIEENVRHFTRVCVLIDDLRCFDPKNPEYSSYPPIDFLVDWTRRNGLKWHVEHDIIVAKS